ncbi:MAG: hypothetical protein LBI45_03260 [Bacteroidales bacterium]|jgi:hypothetical protein|nr:hypothetical protein [Bacteroidales bacterium]
MSDSVLLSHVLSVLIPESLSFFHLVSVSENPTYIELRLEDSVDVIPSELQHIKTVVLDGFTNPIELQSFPLKGKPVYFKIYRHRWKESGSNQHYSHSYDLHYEGVKATREFASFLKDEVGQTLGEYNAFWGFPSR